jgi:hypothetical protein
MGIKFVKCPLITAYNNSLKFALADQGHPFLEVEAKAHFSVQDKSYLGLRNVLSARTILEMQGLYKSVGWSIN